MGFALTCRSTCAAVSVVSDCIRFGRIHPYGVKRYTGIVGIATTGCVACRSSVSVFRPTDKTVICSRRNGGRQCQCHPVSLGLTRRCVCASICIKGDGIGRRLISPNRIQRNRCIVCIACSCGVSHHGCGAACRPTNELIIESVWYRG